MRPFHEAYAEHAPFVWRCVRRLGVREHDVEDATQDVFVIAHKKWAGFRGHASERTWLFEICRRVASDRRRKASTWREVLTETAPDSEVSRSGRPSIRKEPLKVGRIGAEGSVTGARLRSHLPHGSAETISFRFQGLPLK